ncbi:MAG: glycosyl hydrolase family 88, partial [Ruthenibacterium sp.]
HHIAVLDPATGELLDYPEGQGYASGSSWSRGQAWAIYGFAISYRHQKDERYLNIAKSAAHYFLANTARSGHVPLVDFRAPTEPVMYDSTAAVCAACGLLEISEHVSEYEKPIYVQGAMDLLQATTAKFADWNEASDGILGGGTVAYHRKGEVHVPIIYGDYFLLEAVLRLLKKDFFIW